MLGRGHGFQIKYFAWCETDPALAGPEPDIPISNPVHLPPFQEGPPCAYNTKSMWGHDFSSRCGSMPEEKEKEEKRNTLKPFRTPLLSTALFQVARRFLSQPGQEKQALHFRDWIGCGFMCVGRSGGKGGTGENESISKQSKAKRNWIIFTGMKGTAFYLFSRNSNQVRAFFSGIQQIVLGPE